MCKTGRCNSERKYRLNDQFVLSNFLSFTKNAMQYVITDFLCPGCYAKTRNCNNRVRNGVKRMFEPIEPSIRNLASSILLQRGLQPPFPAAEIGGMRTTSKGFSRAMNDISVYA